MFEFDESLPYFGLLEDQYFDDLTKGDKKLIEVIVRDYISESIIDADKEDRPLVRFFVDHFAV